MVTYRAPRQDTHFVLYDLFAHDAHVVSLAGHSEPYKETLLAILDQAEAFAPTHLVPINRQGDQQGCRFTQGKVNTPDGFAEAYRHYCDSGWATLVRPEAIGGQTLPATIGLLHSEIINSANASWSMYVGFSQCAMRTIEMHGSHHQQRLFLPALVSGQHTGTVCLTESKSGSDLSLLRTRGEPKENGNYAIYGSKVFLSVGECDLADNIIHTVLARLPNTSAGTRWISLFIVSKNIIKHGPNPLSCGGIEQKMRLHGNAACTLNFDGAEDYLLGEAYRCLAAMFTFMNLARLGVLIQGLARAEWGDQASVDYAQTHQQMKSVTAKESTKATDFIVEHADVQRILLTQQALTESLRMLVYFTAMQLDSASAHTELPTRAKSDALLSFLTPIAKAFSTKIGLSVPTWPFKFMADIAIFVSVELNKTGEIIELRRYMRAQ